MMEIKIAEDQKTWNNFLRENNGHFTQSWEWGDILISEGKKIDRLQVLDSGRITAEALVIYTKLPFGVAYAFAPLGPVFAKISEDDKTKCLQLFNNYFSKKSLTFWRIEPKKSVMNAAGCMHVKDVNPSTTLFLDLTNSEDEILKNVEKKTRYEIRQAQKNNVSVVEKKDFDFFWDLMQKTAAHDKFSTHDKAHYLKILESELSRQLIAYYNNQPVASAIFVGFGNTFTYLFAASDRSYNQFSASYLIQLEALRLAKGLGYKNYDFFGIAPKISSASAGYDYDRGHRYAGFTKFKIGFGGSVAERAGTFDVVLSPIKYSLYKLFRFLRRL